MFKFLGFGKRKVAQTGEPLTQPPSSPDQMPSEVSQFPKIGDFEMTASDLFAEERAIEQAFQAAASQALQNGLYGQALFFELVKVTSHEQLVDEIVDNLPEWAFGTDRPSEHFRLIVHAWAKSTTSDPIGEYMCFKQNTLMAGWRPGDVNAYWVLYNLLGDPTGSLEKRKHPLALDQLPGDIALRKGEVPIYNYLHGQAEALMSGGGNA